MHPSHPRLAAAAVVSSLLAAAGCYVGPGLGPATEGTETGLSGDSDDSDDSDVSAGESSDASTGDASTGASTGDGTTGGDSDSDGTTGDVTASAGSTTGDDSAGGSTTGDNTTTGDSTTTGMSTSTTTSGSSSGSTSTTTGGMGAYCDGDDDWMGSWTSLEEEVVVVVNQKRSEGANCGSEGSFGAAGPLVMHPLLQCAARLHSMDMVVRDFFNHTNPDGESPWDRIAKTGYGGYANAGENIAAGSATAAAVVDQWMNSDGHCANIMNPQFNEIGVGYYPGGQYGHYWTQVFTKK